ncbi:MULTISPECIES: PIN domain-containing protein [unclassified Methylobacterium]|jgi:tRNA(fMet)-specific endonuclease VapC|uniref:PIN domain-containing protein n=1 Tax=unclassified Methylobacterium TaxID=2615210 RepID=UPI001353593F|nr:PIN domain-containing protein [Methylobacterium sp. 2A]MWV25522.1 type II toxin-antitoxin system VapC family toxin [Methylobacterium sp. 2A]
MLDTNICIHIRRARPPQVLERFRSLKPGAVVMSPITLDELLFSVEKIRDTPRFAATNRALAQLTQLISTAPSTHRRPLNTRCFV